MATPGTGVLWIRKSGETSRRDARHLSWIRMRCRSQTPQHPQRRVHVAATHMHYLHCISEAQTRSRLWGDENVALGPTDQHS